VFALYLTDAWRAFRAWGVSAISPWEHELFWKLRPGVDRRRVELDVDWDHLQRPGFSPDYLDQRPERFDLAFERSDWIPTAAAQALIRNNRPLLAFIGGKQASVTGKDHDFLPGDTVEKQIVVINNSRRAVTCDCQWTLALPEPVSGRQNIAVQPGGQERILLTFKLPHSMPPGKFGLRASMAFSDGETQEDRFTIDVLLKPIAPQAIKKIALFDPQGDTGRSLREMRVDFQPVAAGDDLAQFDTLVIGKRALTVDGPAPSIKRFRDGLRVLMFEQTADVLENRLGFRVQEYGLRNVFPRVPDHPLLAGIGADQLHDWRGESTLSPPRLKYDLRPRLGPTVTWCGLSVPRLWRCGNKGNVASVLIEKPTRGDFLPIVDGGYSLQYSPLLEYREGRGMILFCQLDVTGRSEPDPAAETLARNMLQYVSAWKPAAHRQAAFAGDPAAQKYFESLGVSATPYDGGALHADQTLIVAPGGGKTLTGNAPAITKWLKDGGNLVAFGLDQQDLDGFLPRKVRVRHQEHIAAYFRPPGTVPIFAESAQQKRGLSPFPSRGYEGFFAGIGPADVHNRDPRDLPLITDGAAIIGDGVLAQADSANIVFCQAAPWQFSGDQLNLRKTRRRLAFLASRLLANAGVAGSTPLVERFRIPLANSKPEQRWLDGLYIDRPEEWDDPYRFFRW
jgi:beta-galactosidase